MKRDIYITFESKDSSIEDCDIFLGLSPDNKESFSREELMLSGYKIIIPKKLEKKMIPERLGFAYSIKIDEEDLDKFNKLKVLETENL